MMQVCPICGKFVFKCASCIEEKVRSLCKIEVSYTIITGSKFCLSVSFCQERL